MRNWREASERDRAPSVQNPCSKIIGRGHRLAKSLGLGLTGLLFLCQPARANGRFPRASQLVVDRADPSHLLVSATYGLLTSADAGRSWSLICEAGYGSVGTEDAAVAIMQGTLLVGVHAGLSVATDGSGCAFAWATSPLARMPTIDVAIDPGEPSHALALASAANVDDGGFSFNSALSETVDNGKTWQLAGAPLARDLEAFTVDPAPSIPKRVYVSGISVASSQHGLIERSDDRGATWQRWPIQASVPGSLPFIAAVDPKDADTVYVRVTRGAEVLLVSNDGARSWRTIYDAASPIVGFALAPDASKVALGTKSGIFVAHTSDYDFQQTNTIAPTCLTWTDAGLYACAQETTVGFSIGLSVDDGAHFNPLYHLALECGPNCPAVSPTALACTAAPCEAPASSGGAGGEAHDSGADSAAGDAGVLASAGSGGAATSARNEAAHCACGVAVGGRRMPGAWLAPFACACFARRLRGRRQRRGQVR